MLRRTADNIQSVMNPNYFAVEDSSSSSSYPFQAAVLRGNYGDYGELELNAKSGYESVITVDTINAGSSSSPRATNILVFRGTATSWSSSYNNITTTGVYYIQGTALTSSPDTISITWAPLLVINLNGMIVQTVIKGGTGKIYTREYSGNPLQWSSWATNN
jgi:hypothetical protein